MPEAVSLRSLAFSDPIVLYFWRRFVGIFAVEKASVSSDFGWWTAAGTGSAGEVGEMDGGAERLCRFSVLRTQVI